MSNVIYSIDQLKLRQNVSVCVARVFFVSVCGRLLSA